MRQAPIPFDHPYTKADLRKLETLRQIMSALRDRETGCPWDVEQDFTSIAPYTIEEAYEVADAIGRGNLDDLCEELGDLLLQVIYHSQMASEEGAFSLDEVIEGISTKMVRRHPHVFGDEETRQAGVAKGFWEKIKASEKEARGEPANASILNDVPLPLPALTRAEKLQKRAARAGFDWPEPSGVKSKVAEELSELDEALQTGDQAHMSEEFGDLLFSMVNLARHHNIDPEEALRQANAKFTGRFQHIERQLGARGSTLESATLEEMDALWDEAKAQDR